MPPVAGASSTTLLIALHLGRLVCNSGQVDRANANALCTLFEASDIKSMSLLRLGKPLYSAVAVPFPGRVTSARQLSLVSRLPYFSYGCPILTSVRSLLEHLSIWVLNPKADLRRYLQLMTKCTGVR
ncbi:hypothetical protein K456DRAFT_641571 [Colletotrichum gloeosporioides 23]|nr:hypothetical protein K456DRAFT_641571 [Colletotrichum gloeosporioides 23]